MIRMRMCQEQCIDSWQVGDGDSRCAHSRQEPAKSCPEMWVRENPYISKFKQQRRMTDVRNSKWRRSAVGLGDSREYALEVHRRVRDVVCRARSRAISHCCGRAATF